MIDPALDVSRWRRALAERGRAQIEPFLTPDAAERLHQCLEREVPWTLAWRDGVVSKTLPPGEWPAMPPEARQALLARCHEVARDGYGFAYESYMMVRAYLEGRDPELVLHRVLEFFNSPDYLAFARALTGHAGLVKINAQATCYRPGMFLKQHNDLEPQEGRQFAYVLNLSRRWEADWGGLLQFLDDEGRVIDTLLPRYNTLSIFRVPAHHCVSLVAPWAREPRFAITGWMLA